MKKLIRTLSYAICILLLTCTFCDLKAQELFTVYQTINRDTTGVYYESEFGNPPSIMFGNPYPTVLNIDMLIEYEMECYNDSTNIRAHKDEEEYEDMCFALDDTGCKAKGHHKYIWIHKEPTFKDFMQWVRKKYRR